MFKSYFKTAWRHLVRNKVFSAINIVGLSIDTAVRFVIMLYMREELSYDHFNRPLA